MEKKSSVKEVYKTIKQDLPELHKILCNKLGRTIRLQKSA